MQACVSVRFKRCKRHPRLFLKEWEAGAFGVSVRAGVFFKGEEGLVADAA